MNPKPVVLIVDDEAGARENVRRALSKEEFSIEEASSSLELKAKLESGSIDVVILDLSMLNFRNEHSLTAGLDCLEYIRENHPEVPAIVFTDYSDPLRREAFKRGAFNYIVKNQRGAQRMLRKSVKEAWCERMAGTRERTSEQEEAQTEDQLPHLQERDRKRIERQIEKEYELLTTSEETLNRIRAKRYLETDPKEVVKLKKQELEEQRNIEEIEERIRKLRRSLAEWRTDKAHAPEEGREPEIQVLPILQFDIVPTGIYHLLEKVQNLPLVTYKITNNGQEDAFVIITSLIERYSDEEKNTLKIEAGATISVQHLPVLIPEAVKNVTRITNATFHATVRYLRKGQEQTTSDNVYKIKLHARDTIPWVVANAATSETYDLTPFLAAWITPHISVIERLLRKAIGYHPIVGYQGPHTLSGEEKAALVRSQVKAMFQTLKNEGGIKYLSSTISFGQKDSEAMQRVRLPRVSLESSVANCIDGAVLFASLVESADMNPVVVLVPGHAFVGWETWESSGRYEYLETTMIGSSSFEEAWQRGMDEFQAAQSLGYFKVVSVKESRQQGILPME